MEKRRTLVSVAALLGTGLALGGCNTQQVDGLSQINQTSAARIEQLNQEVKTLQVVTGRKQARIDELESEVAGLNSIRSELEGQVSSVRTRQASLQNALGNLRMTTIDPDMDRALSALAAQHSDIIRYDAAQSMIMFTSDLTFNSGSDELKSGARDGLRQLGQIMMSPSGSAYDLRVVGHTDSQRMSNPATLRRFGTNRGLSFYRAASVEKALRETGMPGARIETVGWGEFRPMAANNSKGGTAANRRVEIFIISTSASASPGTYQADAPTDNTVAQPDHRMPMK